MSPEQIRGDKVDGRSDIFSLGVIVYEMAADNRPFLGESLATISNRVLSQMPKKQFDKFKICRYTKHRFDLAVFDI